MLRFIKEGGRYKRIRCRWFPGSRKEPPVLFGGSSLFGVCGCAAGGGEALAGLGSRVKVQGNGAPKIEVWIDAAVEAAAARECGRAEKGQQLPM